MSHDTKIPKKFCNNPQPTFTMKVYRTSAIYICGAAAAAAKNFQEIFHNSFYGKAKRKLFYFFVHTFQTSTRYNNVEALFLIFDRNFINNIKRRIAEGGKMKSL